MKKYIKRVIDAVKDLPMFRGDIQTGIYAQHLVRSTIRELFRFEYEETKYASGELLSLDTSLDEGSKEFSFSELGSTGRAKIVADNATDIPYAELEGRLSIRPVKTLAVKVQWSTQDVRTSRLQGLFQIATEKASAAREAHDFALNDLLRTGSPPAGLDGFTNAPGIHVMNATTGSWASATALQIVADFITAATFIPDQSRGVEMPNTVVMPVSLWNRVSTLQNSAASDATVLKYLQTAFPYITTWTWEPGLSTASQAGGNAIMIYKKDPSRQRGVVPMLLRPLPPEQHGLVFEVTFESRFGGVIAPKPLAMLRLEGV